MWLGVVPVRFRGFLTTPEKDFEKDHFFVTDFRKPYGFTNQFSEPPLKESEPVTERETFSVQKITSEGLFLTF